MIYVKRQLNNPEVTNYYLDTICDAFVGLGFTCRNFVDFSEVKADTDDIFIVSTPTEAILPLLKRRKFIIWYQGIMPEESYLKHHQLFRKIILSKVEKITLKKSIFRFFISNSMKNHYETKYKMIINSGYHIMPCGNEDLHEEMFFANKYKNNIFCYVGSTDNWQCFEQTLKLYKKIEYIVADSKLLLLVKDTEKAIQLLESLSIKNYEIDYVSVDQLKSRLVNVHYGFILREDLELNRVATPTKLSTYLSNGIVPIYSDCLVGIKEIMMNVQNQIIVHSFEDVNSIEKYIFGEHDTQFIKEEYERLFLNYYNREKHISEIISKFGSIKQD